MKFIGKTNSNFSKKMLSNSSESLLKTHQPRETSTSVESYLQNISSVEVENLPIVLVEWWDALCVGGTEWQSCEEVAEAIEKGPALIRSVGYLIEQNTTFVALVDTLSVGGDSTGYLHIIPNGMVSRIISLKPEQ